MALSNTKRYAQVYILTSTDLLSIMGVHNIKRLKKIIAVYPKFFLTKETPIKKQKKSANTDKSLAASRLFPVSFSTTYNKK